MSVAPPDCCMPACPGPRGGSAEACVLLRAGQECHINVSEEAIRGLMLAEGCAQRSDAGVIMRAETFKRCLLHGIACAQGADGGIPSAAGASRPCSRPSTFGEDGCPVSPTARAH